MDTYSAILVDNSEKSRQDQCPAQIEINPNIRWVLPSLNDDNNNNNTIIIYDEVIYNLASPLPSHQVYRLVNWMRRVVR